MTRTTRQRTAIKDALARLGRPLSPQELLDAAQRDVPSVGLATVYRTVKALVDDGTIVAVALPGEPDRYELAGAQHHHHFRCRRCDRVYEIEGCPGGLASLVPPGFELDGHEVVLYGRCRACGRATRSAAAATAP